MDGKTMVCPPSAFKDNHDKCCGRYYKKINAFHPSLLFDTLLNYSLEKGESNLLHHSLYYFVITQLQSHTLTPIPFLMFTCEQKATPPPKETKKKHNSS